MTLREVPSTQPLAIIDETPKREDCSNESAIRLKVRNKISKSIEKPSSYTYKKVARILKRKGLDLDFACSRAVDLHTKNGIAHKLVEKGVIESIGNYKQLLESATFQRDQIEQLIEKT